MKRADPAVLRRLKLFRPYPDAVPWDLFERAELDDAAHDGLANAVARALDDEPVVQLRVARLDDDAVGAYLLDQPAPYRFRLIYLQLDVAWRGQGVGRWLLGHALGLAESKGGRALSAAPCDRYQRFLEGYGFQHLDGELRYPFIPE
ncbi:MAG: GNAT family N-acetyltransferase [Pseudomonadota bacterium]